MKRKSDVSKKKKLNFWVKFSMFFVLAFFLIAIVKMNMQINDAKKDLSLIIEEYDSRVLRLEERKSQLNSLPDNIEDLDEETIRKIAKDKLGLCDSDVIIFANSQPN